MEISSEIVKKIDSILGKSSQSPHVEHLFLYFSFLIIRVKERTYSFWNYVLQNVNDFKNPLFRPQSNYASGILLPNLKGQTLR